jgi:hypothetical protein
LSPPAQNQPEVRLAPDSAEKLQALFESELRHRRAFVAGRFALADRQRCSLVVVHPDGRQFAIAAEAVFIKSDEPGAGLGLALIGLDSATLADLEAFVRPRAEVPRVGVPPADASPAVVAGPRNVYDRIRHLGLRERETVARQGLLAERVALERAFGSSVWEGLLRNPQLTIPEVAQIAKKGALPIPLVSIIVANNGWLACGEVRRALLGNPRVSGIHLDRVLQATPRVELKQIAKMSPYRSLVRAAAKKMVGVSGAE